MNSNNYEFAKSSYPQSVSEYTNYTDKQWNYLSDINSQVYSNNSGLTLVTWDLTSVYSAGGLCDVSRRQQSDRKTQDQGQKCAQRGNVESLDQGVVHPLGVIGPVHRPHTPEEIQGLLGRIVEKLRNDLDPAQGPHDGSYGKQVEREAADALGRGKALPDPNSHRLHRLCCRAAHWNTFRSQPEKNSDTMMIAMMASRIVMTKS